jgi:hypothetical protein
VNLSLDFLANPLHDLRARVLALASEFDHPFHLRQRQTNAFRLQDELNVVVRFGTENAVPGVSSRRFRQQSDLSPVPQCADGSCPVKGYGVILVTFILSQPAGMLTAGFTPIESDSLFVALAAKSGTLTLAKGGIPSVDVMNLPSARYALALRDQVSVRQVHPKFERDRYAKPK